MYRCSVSKFIHLTLFVKNSEFQKSDPRSMKEISDFPGIYANGIVKWGNYGTLKIVG